VIVGTKAIKQICNGSSPFSLTAIKLNFNLKFKIMIIDKEMYKGFEIEITFNKDTKCFKAYSKIGTAGNKFDTVLGNFCMGFSTPT